MSIFPILLLSARQQYSTSIHLFCLFIKTTRLKFLPSHFVEQFCSEQTEDFYRDSLLYLTNIICKFREL